MMVETRGIAAKLNRSVRNNKTRAYAIGLPLKWFKLKANEARPPPKRPTMDAQEDAQLSALLESKIDRLRSPGN
jgi:hypothetical protein